MSKEDEKVESSGTPGGEDAQALLARIGRLVEREGGTDGAISKLLGENAEYRARIRELEQETTTLRGKVPADGATMLTPEDANAFEAYRQLGAPDEVAQKIARLEADVFSTGRAVRVQQAASVLGFDADVLSSLARGDDGRQLDVVVKDEEAQQDGKQVTVKVPYLVVGDEQVKVADYAERHWSKFMPSLRKAEAGGGKPDARMPGQSKTVGKASEFALPSLHNRPKL